MFKKEDAKLINASPEHREFIRKIKKRRRIILSTQVAILFLGLIFWELFARLNIIDTFLTSYPSAIWRLFVRYVTTGSLFHHVGISVMETVVGFIAGTILGIVVAILLWWSNFVAKVLDPYLVVLNSLPKTALAPIIILWVGAGYSGIIVTAIAVSIVFCYYLTLKSYYYMTKSIHLQLTTNYNCLYFKVY